MEPNSAVVVMAVSLAVIGIASIAAGTAAVFMAIQLRRFFRAVEALGGPAVADVRHMVRSIRAEADALVGTSRDVRVRIIQAADAAEARLTDLDALMDVVQGEVEQTALDVAATLRDARSGVRLWQWASKLLGAPRDKKPKKRSRR